jgi:sulfate adenylyltransferase subunit 1 (EFTu-like GTPase family)
VEKDNAATWYEGPSVLDLLETLDVAPSATVGARLAVQWTLREHGGSDYRGYAGRLEGGVLRVGDAVVVHPKGNSSVVVGLTRAGTPTDIAVPGDAIAIELADDLDVGKFDVIVAQLAVQPLDTNSVTADVCWFSEEKLHVGDTLVVRHQSGESQGRVTRIVHRLDLDTLQNSATTELVLNDIARIEITLTTPLVVDSYGTNRIGGSAIAVDPVTNATIGALMFVGAQSGSSPSPRKRRLLSVVRDFIASPPKESFN